MYVIQDSNKSKFTLKSKFESDSVKMRILFIVYGLCKMENTLVFQWGTCWKGTILYAHDGNQIQEIKEVNSWQTQFLQSKLNHKINLKKSKWLLNKLQDHTYKTKL